MATRTWTGTTDGDFGTAGNWAEAAVPVANDDVVVASGSVDIDGSAPAIDLDSFAVGPDYSGSIGSSATYLTLAADRLVINSGHNAGDIYLDGGAQIFDVVVIDSAAVNQTIYFKGTITTMILRRGNIKLVSGTTTTCLFEGAAGVPILEIDAATVTSMHRITPCSVSMTSTGTVTTDYGLAGTFVVDAGTVTNYELRGGSVVHKTTATCASAKLYAGSFDASQDVRAKTFTNVETHGTVSANFDNGMNNITFTNPPTVYGNVPTKLAFAGATLTIA